MSVHLAGHECVCACVRVCNYDKGEAILIKNILCC